MEFFATITFFWISVAALILGGYLEISTGRNFIFYGQMEKAKIFQDRYGHFSTKKFLIVLSIVAAGGYAATFYHPVGGTFIVLGGSFVSIIYGLNNRKGAKNQREQQIMVLRQLRDTGRMRTLPFVRVAGRTFFKMFGWVYSTLPDIDDAIAEIAERLNVLCHHPEETWFPR